MSLEYVPIRFNQGYLEFRDNQKNTVLVAVMDTGIDPGAYGLTKCPDGSAKIIDVIDCTGSDDVIVSVIDKASIENKAIIKLIDQYDPTGSSKVYIGRRDFKSFISNRSYKGFEKKQQNIIDTLIFKIYVVNKMLILDYDGIDDHLIILNEYHLNQKFGSILLGDNLQYNFGFHLYESHEKDKAIASLVFDTGSHATHVAGIIGGYFEDDVARNGINPHAKILSLKIGDSRVDGMETTIGFIRALKEIVKHDCHLANYSYGEAVEKIEGKLIDMLNEYIVKYNITFCTSAGNSGPSITTVGAPAVCTTQVISVGAYTDAKILNSVYYMTENDFEQGVYHWSSRGPGLDNSMGVDLIAPGCAITSHPKWFRADMKLCNGTSMASPNTAGFLSLILSQFSDTAHYPQAYWVKKYAESSCKFIDKTSDHFNVEAFAQGHGLVGYDFVDINEYFNESREYYYDISVNQSTNKGLMIIEKKIDYADATDDHIKISSHTIEIVPKSDTIDLPTFKRVLKLEATDDIAEYLSFPETIMVNNSNMSFRIDISVDTRNIGSQTDKYFTNSNHIAGYLELYEEIVDGSNTLVAYVPINIFFCQEMKVGNTYSRSNESIFPNKVIRSYVLCDGNAMKIKLDTNILDKIFIGVVQKVPNTALDNRSNSVMYTKDKNQEEPFKCTIKPNVLTEISIYTAWSSPESQCVDYSISIEKKDIKVSSALIEYNQNARVECDKDLKEVLKINHIVCKYLPTLAEIVNVDSRYVFNSDYKKMNPHCDESLKLLRLTYKINSHKNTTYYVNTCDKVYETDTFMSACIIGYVGDEKVFFANYAPKTCEVALDKVVIEIMDSNLKTLEYHARTILTALRKISKPISISKSLKEGLNLIACPQTEIQKLDDSIYDGDYLRANIDDTYFYWIYKSKPKIRNTLKEDQNKEKEDVKNEDMVNIDKFIKDFDLFKKFLCKLEANDVFNIEIDVKNLNDSLTNIKKRSYDEMIDLTDTDRAKIDYLHLLTKEDISLSDDPLIKKLYDRFKADKLLKTAPYCAVEYVQSKKGIKRFKAIDAIEKNMSYWKNCNQKDINELKLQNLKEIDASTLPDLSYEEKEIANKCRDQDDDEIMSCTDHRHLVRKYQNE